MTLPVPGGLPPSPGPPSPGPPSPGRPPAAQPSAGQPSVPPLVVRCDNLVHVYGTPGSEVAALRGVDLTVRPGEMVALLGPSGAGKTTLLWHLAGLLRPTAGRVEINGRRLTDLSAGALARFRLNEVGLLLQNPARNVLPYQSALGNLLFAQAPAQRSVAARRTRAAELLDRVGLAGMAHRRAGRLSGGEQQRLALAVALANEPGLLLADEPTTQLDPVSAAAVIGRAVRRAAAAGSGRPGPGDRARGAHRGRADRRAGQCLTGAGAQPDAGAPGPREIADPGHPRPGSRAALRPCGGPRRPAPGSSGSVRLGRRVTP